MDAKDLVRRLVEEINRVCGEWPLDGELLSEAEAFLAPDEGEELAARKASK